MSYEPRITSHESRVTTLRSALRDAIAQLESEHIPSAPLAAELLLMHTLGRDRTWLYAHSEQELDAATRERYFSLIPRPETEHVIEVVLERLAIAAGNAASQRDAAHRIADVGTGSGCIAVALAHEFPSARITATDISAAALEVARRNAARYGVESRIDFIESNLLDSRLHESRLTNHPSFPVRASESRFFDAIASNPPYIGRNEAATLPREVREHEPDTALFGGETGTEIYAPLIAQAAALLKPDGILVLELGHNSAEHVSRLLTAPAWSDLALTSDLSGIKRVASARRTSTCSHSYGQVSF